MPHVRDRMPPTPCATPLISRQIQNRKMPKSLIVDTFCKYAQKNRGRVNFVIKYLPNNNTISALLDHSLVAWGTLGPLKNWIR